MITAFNRKVIFEGTDAEESARIWSTLEKHGIKYEMKTKTGTDPFERQLKQNANMHFMAGGIPASYMDDRRNYLYIIYVHKNDFDAAQKLLNE